VRRSQPAYRGRERRRLLEDQLRALCSLGAERVDADAVCRSLSAALGFDLDWLRDKSGAVMVGSSHQHARLGNGRIVTLAVTSGSSQLGVWDGSSQAEQVVRDDPLVMACNEPFVLDLGTVEMDRRP
jgi:hypothetical protein